MLFDTHIHTEASPDGGALKPSEAIRIAKEKGIGIIFTEHADHTPDGLPSFCVDFNTYPSQYVKYKSDTVLLGIELNLMNECIELNTKIAANPLFDYILGSVHCTSGFDLGDEVDNTVIHFNKYGEEFNARHLAYILDTIKNSDCFDSLGHIDYISRYCVLPEKNLLYERHADAYDAILSTLIERGKLIEVNTRRLTEEGALANLTTIYTRYRDLGGKYVTLGSDAHFPENIGRNFDIAVKMVNEIGLKFAYFKGRRMLECITT